MKLKKYQFKKVKSTNDVAIKKIKSGIKSGIILTETQKKGRGQYGKKWISFKGNLLMSVFFEINKSISIKKITLKNCEIIKKSIQKFIKNKIKIKPPNDLLINKEKICGILQETFFQNKKKFIVVGIGLNLVNICLDTDYYLDGIGYLLLEFHGISQKKIEYVLYEYL